MVVTTIYDILVEAIFKRLNLTTCVAFNDDSGGHLTTSKNFEYDCIYDIVPKLMPNMLLHGPNTLLLFKDDQIILTLVELWYSNISDLIKYNKHVIIPVDLADPNTEPLYLINDVVNQIITWYCDILSTDIRVAFCEHPMF